MTSLTRENNLDSVRFWTAMIVLWSHSIPLTQGDERNELSFRLSQGQTTTGTIGVFVFFALSGFLITRSFERAPTPWHFVRARVLRIMPALLLVVALTAFAIGPLLTTLPWRSYFASPDPYRYWIVQSTMFVGWFDALPGVFTDHPLTTPNGPIWTLRYEAQCYALVFLLGIAGLLRKQLTLALYVAILIALAFYPGTAGGIGEIPRPNNTLNLSAGFLAGALIYQWNIPLDRRLALAALVLTLVCMFSGQMLIAQRTFIPYLALYVALAPIGRIWYPWRGTDVSYGLYIWGWPLSQLVIAALRPNWLVMALLTTPLALAAGWLSWTLLEKHALALKDSPLFGGSPERVTSEPPAPAPV